MVKNVFELYPGGYAQALKEFNTAWEWGVNTYPFSSLPDYASGCETTFSPIIEKGIAGELFPDPQTFKSHSREMLLGRKNISEDILKLSLE
jgi:hypothetical protein